MGTETLSQIDSNDVAIVGIALHFPGAHGAQEFWANLRAGVESLRQFTDAELAARGVPARLLRNPNYVKCGQFLEGVDQFDAEFFGFSPKDAAILDPQHRHFLECAWETLEDAGHPPETIAGPIGVFGGCGMGNYYIHNLLSNPALVESVGLFLLRHTGNDKDFLTTRVSYCLDLKGPSINIQTACSTSLVAVHAACQSLLVGECDLALAGGVSIEIPHGVGYTYREGEILSPDGHCRSFGENSKGTVFGSGVGIVALRRREDALRDGDRIYAIVKGSAVNNDGASKVGYLAPSVDGQAAAITEALASAGIEPDSVEYVEAHGSGTPIGEPIEVAALTQAFNRSTSRKSFCGLGSVKANIGHLDTAAGVASLIKASLALHHGEIPPTPNFTAPNPDIPFASGPFFVVDRLRAWPRNARPRRAGVNSLGVGGTNAHVILEEPPEPAASSATLREWQVLCVSARSKKALDESARRLAAHLRANTEQSLADVAFTLLNGRRGFAHRRVLAVRGRDEAIAQLESAGAAGVFDHTSGTATASVVFLLPGGGMQHVRMGCDLYEAEPAFRALVDRGVDEFLRRTGRDLRPLWISPTDTLAAALELERPSLQLPAIFILEHALATFWMSLGVRPDALIGHSLGENTAACLAGVMSFEDALGLVALRGELFELLPPGGMLSVAVCVDDLTPYLGPDLDVAAINSTTVTVVSGPVAALDDLARRLADAGVDARRIPITTAAHSRLVEPILARFLEYLRSIELHAPRIPFISNCSGTWITPEQAVRPEYWVEHLRGTVRFVDGIRTLLTDPARVFLEVGPGKALSSLVRQHPDSAGVRGLIATLRHAEEKTSDVAHFLAAFGRLWACGVPIDRAFLWRGEQRRRVSLPSYAFQHKRHWIEPGKTDAAPVQVSREPRRVDLLTEGFYRPIWKAKHATPAPAAAKARDWLVFLDSAGLGERLATRLRARGDSVITVRESDDNRRLGDEEFALAPERGREGYVELVRELVTRGRVPQRVIHLWMLTPDESFRPGSNFFHRNQERGFYSLLFLAQALGDEGVNSPLHISVVSNGMQALDGEPLLHPGKATILGPCKVTPREFPGVTCSSIDIPLPVSKTLGRRAARSGIPEPLADLVEAEVLSAPCNAIVAYRGGVRHEQEFERTTLSPARGNGHAPVRERGVYMITGGLGGLGLLVASHFAQQARARIVLVNRSQFPERARWDDWIQLHGHEDPTSRRIRAVQEIEATGSEVSVACADVTDIEAMRGVIEETRRRFGGLNGVVHAAGVLRDSPLLSKSQREIEDVFASKVHGTLVLDALLHDVDLDFMLLFSSVSALIGPPGQVDYVAASAFLDAYARSKFDAYEGAPRGTTTRHTVSVDWGIWSEFGMAADALRAAAAPVRERLSGSTPRHPLFDARVGDPDSPLVLSARYTPKSRWILDEHRTRAGRAIVPGAAYLELARAALAEAGEHPTFEIRDMLLLRPLHMADDESSEVRVELQPSAEGYAFSVRSRALDPRASESSVGDSAWETHAQARLVMRSPAPSPALGLRDIAARCAVSRCAQGPDALPPLQADLVRFGPRWRTLRELRLGQDEALAILELNQAFAADFEHFRLHPALLDIATTCALELPELQGASKTGEELWVPLSYKSVRVHARLPSRILSWVKSRDTNRGGDSVLVFDVVVADEAGVVCVEIDEFTMRRISADVPIARAQGAGVASLVAPEPHLGQQRTDPSARSSSPGLSALRRNFEQGISPAQGMEALQRILGSAELSQVVATSLDLDGLRAEMDAIGAMPDGIDVDSDRAESEVESGHVEALDAIERTLVGFWQELLGVRKVGLRDSFFDLGGHSLIAVRLFARIKKTYSVEFPISILFEAPTIERCAAAIRQALQIDAHSELAAPAAAQARHTYLVPMHPGQGGGKTPFILVAGMFGNVLNLRHLAHLLGNERRFFGLQAQGLYGTQPPHEKFEEMASAYLAEVRTVQPHGPYLLGGFSGGGITAYAMALELVAAGEEVALLAMLDTALPQSPKLRANERARIHWDRVRRRGPAYVTEWVGNRVRWELAQMRNRQQVHAGLAMPSEFRSEEIGAAFRRALANYEVPAYSGVITLFRPKLDVVHKLGPGRVTNAQREFLFHDNGWGAHVGRVDVHEVPGDHDSMVLEPNVRVLAAKLRKCIQEVESAAPRLASTNGRHDARN
jgi:acyl transferase domain-containing protein/thioesterase domain-containing protein